MKEMIEFIHPCHTPTVDSDRIEFRGKGSRCLESELPKEWLQGALEHLFCKRVQVADPIVATGDAAGGESAGSGTVAAADAAAEAGVVRSKPGIDSIEPTV